MSKTINIREAEKQQAKCEGDLNGLINDLAELLKHLKNVDQGFYEKLIPVISEKYAWILAEIEKFRQKGQELEDMYLDINNSLATFHNHDRRFDILEFFLDHPFGYQYIEEIIIRIPDFINVRNRLNGNIIISLIDAYIESVENDIRDLTDNTLARNKYHLIHEFFLNHPEFIITEEDKEEIRDKIKEAVRVIKDKRLSSDVKRFGSFKVKEVSYESKSNSNYQIEMIPYLSDEIMNQEDRRNLTEEYTFAIDLNKSEYGQIAFSVSETSRDNFILKMHTFDMVALCEYIPGLENYIKGQVTDLDYGTILPHVGGFTKNRCLPTITYEYSITKTGDVVNFKVYKSVVRTGNIYSENHFDSDNLITAKKMARALKINPSDYDNSCEAFIGTILKAISPLMTSYCRNKGINFIGTVKPIFTESDLRSYENLLKSTADAKTVLDIVYNYDYGKKYALSSDSIATIELVDPVHNIAALLNQLSLLEVASGSLRRNTLEAILNSNRDICTKLNCQHEIKGFTKEIHS